MKIEALAQMFSCEFCEISKNTFFTEYVWATASVTETDSQFIKNYYSKYNMNLVSTISCMSDKL